MIQHGEVVTLLSNAQGTLFPDNTAHHFINRLPHVWTIPSGERWRVGLCEFSTLNTLESVPMDLTLLVKTNDDDARVLSTVTLPHGHYTQSTFLITLDALWKEERQHFSYSWMDNGKVCKPPYNNRTAYTVSLDPAQNAVLEFDVRFQSILGLESSRVSEAVTAPRSMMLTHFTYNLMIYCNFIKENVQGGRLERVLRTIPFLNNEVVIHKEFQNVQFHDIVLHQLQDLHIVLHDDTGDRVLLREGRTMLKLLFLRQ